MHCRRTGSARGEPAPRRDIAPDADENDGNRCGYAADSTLAFATCKSCKRLTVGRQNRIQLIEAINVIVFGAAPWVYDVSAQPEVLLEKMHLALMLREYRLCQAFRHRKEKIRSAKERRGRLQCLMGLAIDPQLLPDYRLGKITHLWR